MSMASREHKQGRQDFKMGRQGRQAGLNNAPASTAKICMEATDIYINYR